MAGLIAADWGTTNCRAFLFVDDLQVQETREAPIGILGVAEGRFAEALDGLIGDWLRRSPPLPLLLSGMIGSRQGWVEAPYVACPADAAKIAGGLAETTAFGRVVRFVPGLSAPALAGGQDVLRGEEVQILGALALESPGAGPAVLCLPGTHSKWAVVEGGAVQRFVTFMTGEAYAVLRAHSILGRLMADDAEDEAAFAAGVMRSGAAGGLLHHLFGVRTAGLFAELPAAHLGSFLSGLLIGHELRAGLAAMPALPEVLIVGAPGLAQHYVQGLGLLGRSARTIDGAAAAAKGLARIAAAAAL